MKIAYRESIIDGISYSLLKDKIAYDRVRSDIIDLRIAAFKAKVQFSLICGDYTIRTASSRADILKVIELRNHSFVNDFAESLRDGAGPAAHA